jgi:hypothetical protein
LGAADRNDNLIYVRLDNGVYVNTGVQTGSSTPENAWTVTTPDGRQGRKKKFPQTIAAHRIPYAATARIINYTLRINTLLPYGTRGRVLAFYRLESDIPVPRLKGREHEVTLAERDNCSFVQDGPDVQRRVIG